MSKSKQKGTAFETAICTYLDRTYYPGAHRNPLAGNKDIGDIHLPGEDRFILELKNVVKQNLPQWINEAKVEAANFDSTSRAIGVVVHKRHGKGAPEDQWVTMDLGTFLRLVNELSAQVPF